jgi:hypothetical protein
MSLAPGTRVYPSNIAIFAPRVNHDNAEWRMQNAERHGKTTAGLEPAADSSGVVPARRDPPVRCSPAVRTVTPTGAKRSGGLPARGGGLAVVRCRLPFTPHSALPTPHSQISPLTFPPK